MTTRQELFQQLREFVRRELPDVAHVFEQDIEHWDPHVLLLQMSVLHMNHQIIGHVDRRFDELAQVVGGACAPGREMARPGVRILKAHMDPTRVAPGNYPMVEAFGAMVDDNGDELGYLGQEGAFVIPTLRCELADVSQTQQRWVFTFRLHIGTEERPCGSLPPIELFISHSAGQDPLYRLFDILGTPGAHCSRPHLRITHKPKDFSYLWSVAPWHQTFARHLLPYPKKLDHFLQIDGLHEEDWYQTVEGWCADVVFQLPTHVSFEQQDDWQALTCVTNPIVVFAYAQRSLQLEGEQQRALDTPYGDLIWVRASGRQNRPLYPGLMYLNEFFEREEPSVWAWNPHTSPKAPAVLEARNNAGRCDVDYLVNIHRASFWNEPNIENTRFQWYATPQASKHYNAGCGLQLIDQLDALPRVTSSQGRQELWSWLADRHAFLHHPERLQPVFEQVFHSAGVAAHWADRFKFSSSVEMLRDGKMGWVPGLVFSLLLGASAHTKEAHDVGCAQRGRLRLCLKRISRFLAERTPAHLSLRCGFRYTSGSEEFLGAIEKGSRA